MTFFSKLIHSARERAGLSQRELGARANVVQPAVNAWEKGDRPITETTLEKVARALGYQTLQAFLVAEIKELRARERREARKKENGHAHEERAHHQRA